MPLARIRVLALAARLQWPAALVLVSVLAVDLLLDGGLLSPGLELVIVAIASALGVARPSEFAGKLAGAVREHAPLADAPTAPESAPSPTPTPETPTAPE